MLSTTEDGSPLTRRCQTIGIAPILERLRTPFLKRKESLSKRADGRFDFFLNLGGFTLSGRLPIKESNQFLYAVSKARPVCCNDGALTSRSQGNAVFILVSSRLRCAGEVLVWLWEYLVCEKFKR